MNNTLYFNLDSITQYSQTVLADFWNESGFYFYSIKPLYGLSKSINKYKVIFRNSDNSRIEVSFIQCSSNIIEMFIHMYFKDTIKERKEIKSYISTFFNFIDIDNSRLAATLSEYLFAGSKYHLIEKIDRNGNNIQDLVIDYGYIEHGLSNYYVSNMSVGFDNNPFFKTCYTHFFQQLYSIKRNKITATSMAKSQLKFYCIDGEMRPFVLLTLPFTPQIKKTFLIPLFESEEAYLVTYQEETTLNTFKVINFKAYAENKFQDIFLKNINTNFNDSFDKESANSPNFETQLKPYKELVSMISI